MASTTARPLATLERLCAEARTSDELLKVAGDWIADRAEADAHVMCRLDPLSALWNGASDRGYPVNSCTHYREQAFLRSEYADMGLASRMPERVRRLERGVTPTDPYTELYFDNFGYGYEAHISFAVNGQGFGYMTMAKTTEDFGPGVMRLLEGAVTPVTQHLRRLIAKEMLEAVPGEGVGLLAVDRQGGLHGLNDVGRGMQAVLTRRDDARSYTVLGVVAEMARRELLAPGQTPIPRVLYVCPETRRRYRLLAERVSNPGFPEQVLIVAEPVRGLDSVELLRTAGLTEREAEVAMVTLRGFKSVEGAEALGMSEHTFLGHLKVVYRKLGVSSRGEFAALLLSGV
ncbi:MAG: helix-turn-helix transcriptional regulator [Deltaproteobacteria bacterium]|nr:helix-turn-helix transcriptional regulator [Deltaproteobacteria bacterium]